MLSKRVNRFYSEWEASLKNIMKDDDSSTSPPENNDNSSTASLQASNSKLKVELNAALEKVTHQGIELAMISQRNQELAAESSAAQEKLKQKEGELEEAQTQLETERGKNLIQLGNLRSELSDLKRENEQLKKDKKEILTAVIAKMTSFKGLVDKDGGGLKTQSEIFKQKLFATVKKNEKLDKEKAQLEMKHEELKNKLEEKSKLIEEMGNELVEKGNLLLKNNSGPAADETGSASGSESSQQLPDDLPAAPPPFSDGNDRHYVDLEEGELTIEGSPLQGSTPANEENSGGNDDMAWAGFITPSSSGRRSGLRKRGADDADLRNRYWEASNSANEEAEDNNGDHPTPMHGDSGVELSHFNHHDHTLGMGTPATTNVSTLRSNGRENGNGDDGSTATWSLPAAPADGSSSSQVERGRRLLPKNCSKCGKLLHTIRGWNNHLKNCRSKRPRSEMNIDGSA